MVSIQFLFVRAFILSLWIIIFISGSSDGYHRLPIGDEYVCEVYSPKDEISQELLDEGRQMYLEAYYHPPLHLETPVEELRIDLNQFPSYDEYIKDMFSRDFSSYGQHERPIRHYFQLRNIADGCIIGVCVVLETSKPGYYYLDHIGIHWKYRNRGLAGNLIKIMLDQLSDYIEISLDTRVFNYPAQGLYEKWGFDKLPFHPNPEKQNTYLHYIKYSHK